MGFARGVGAALLAGAALTGCSVYRVHPVLEYPETSGFLGVGQEVKPLDLQIYRFREDEPQGALAYTRAATDPGLRNRLQSTIMQVSDASCEQHKGEVLATAANTNLVLTVLTSALAGAGAILSGLTASALAAGASFTNAGNAAFNENVYQKLYVGTIIQAIDKSRGDYGKEIGTKRAKDIAAYPVDEAIRDAQEYHTRCSFYQGLVALNAAITSTPQSRQDIIDQVTILNAEIDRVSRRIRAPTNETGAALERLNADNAGWEGIRAGLRQQIDTLYRRLAAMQPR
jgi:hypothetical protein